MRKFLSNKVALTLFVTPALLLFTCIVIAPIIMSLRYTLWDGMPGVNFTYVGLDNFRKPCMTQSY